jgi:predicted phage-related endonuclease
MEWLEARAGIPTASEFDNLVSPTGKIRTGQTPVSYLARKVAEAWLGGPLPSYQGGAMEVGSILEDEAIPRYEWDYGCKIQRVGLVLTDDGRIGCSPDGLIGDDSGIEIKCPLAQTHVAYLLAGELPADYRLQVQGALYVTGRREWIFMSYCRNFPPFIYRVERDEELIDTIREALAGFIDRFDDATKELEALNGAPRPAKPKRETDQEWMQRVAGGVEAVAAPAGQPPDPETIRF